MPPLSRRVALSLFAATALTAPAQQTFDQPEPPLAVPSVLDVATFRLHSDGEDHKIAVTGTPTLVRVDELSDGYSVIYNPISEHYTGLELKNYTYWEFSWPGVKAAVESTQRYEDRLHEVGSEGMSGDTPGPDPNNPDYTTSNPTIAALLDTNAAPANSTPPPSDDSGYIWKPTGEKKRIAGFECVRWTGDSVSEQPAEAWCYAGPIPQVQNALTQLRAMNEPMALVPVRTLVPPLVFEINASLLRGGVTPVRISWGDPQDKSEFELLSLKQRRGEANLFTVPRLFVKTTLITMADEPSRDPRGAGAAALIIRRSAPRPAPAGCRRILPASF
jgi:hypothetical protein